MVAIIKSLKTIPIFSSLSGKYLEELSTIMLEKTYRKNQVIFDQGDLGNSLITVKIKIAAETESTSDRW